MSSLSVTSAGALAGDAIRRMAVSVRDPVAAGQARAIAAPPSATLSLSTSAADAVVYARPKAPDVAVLIGKRAWATQPQDEISTLMARNSDRGTSGGLASQWRGLGGALLSRLAATGADYQQTLANEVSPEDAASTAASGAETVDAALLSGVQDDAAKVSLRIRTRSGQTVELSLMANDGAGEGRSGLKVGIQASGPLSSSERQALADLAEGFDKVLEGLGQPDQAKLDLSGLLAYDSSVLGSVDLAVKNPRAGQPLSSFELHLGADRKSIQFKGAVGELALNVDAAAPAGAAGAQQRQSAIDEHLRRFDAAAERSHADSRLVGLFKDAFTQLHATATNTPGAPFAALRQTLATQIQPFLSGLADFDASFHGKFERMGARGNVVEAGEARYQASQKTSVRPTRGAEDLSITQEQRETLTAQYLRSRADATLDTSSGYYDAVDIQDSRVVTTALSTLHGELDRGDRQTEEHRLYTLKRLVNHRVDTESRTPVDKLLQEQLF